jgi:hypothetical protein
MFAQTRDCWVCKEEIKSVREKGERKKETQPGHYSTREITSEQIETHTSEESERFRGALLEGRERGEAVVCDGNGA